MPSCYYQTSSLDSLVNGYSIKHGPAAFQVASQMKEYMKHVLKGKNSLDGLVDKIKASGAADAKTNQWLGRTI